MSAPGIGGRWTLQMLGGLVARHGEVEIHFPDRGVARLLSYLLLHPRPQERHELAEILWPVDAIFRRMRIRASRDPVASGVAATFFDNPVNRLRQRAQERQRKLLNNTVSTLRGLLTLPAMPEVAVVLSRTDTLQINLDLFEVDVDHFQRCVARGEVGSAARWYRGELLPGLDDDWIEEFRRALRAQSAALRERTPGAQGDPDEDGEPRDGPRRLPRLDRSATPIVGFTDGFFGRDAEVEALRQHIVAHRLVALTAPGGMGKTRLAIKACERLPQFMTVFVPLSDCPSLMQVTGLLCKVLRVQASEDQMVQQIALSLRGRVPLFVFDSFEHLVGPKAVELIDALLREMPQAHVLLTSTRALHHREEHRFELGPLQLPPADCDAAEAARNPAVALFLERARAIRADYHLHERNLRGIVNTCRVVEGMPLLIALMAAHVRQHRPPDELCKSLVDRMHTLSRRGDRPARSGASTARPIDRHASVEGTLSIGWRLLEPPLRSLISALAMFRGGWTASQAEILAGDTGVHAALEQLDSHSLVYRSATVSGGMRWHMYGVVRDFVTGRMSSAEGMRLRERHRKLFLDETLRIRAQRTRLPDDDLPNCVAAIESGMKDGEVRVAVDMAVALASRWLSVGASADTLDLLVRLIAIATPEQPNLVELMAEVSRLLVNQGRGEEGIAMAVRAMSAAKEDASQGCRSRTIAALAHESALWRTSRDRHVTSAPAERLVAEARALHEPDLLARTLLLQGAVLVEADPARADTLFKEAQQLHARLGDRQAGAVALPGRVVCMMTRGDYRRALRLINGGLSRCERSADVATALQLMDRATVCHEMLGDLQGAVEACRRQARLASRHGMTYYMAFALWNLCDPLARLGRAERAARLMGFSAVFWTTAYGALNEDDRRYVAGVRQRVAGRIGQRRAAAVGNAGKAMSLSQAVTLALSPDEAGD